MNEQERELEDCICIYALDLFSESNATKNDTVKAVVEGVYIWERGINDRLKDYFESSEILRCLDHCTYDVLHDPKATKLMLWADIIAGLYRWRQGMLINLKEKGQL